MTTAIATPPSRAVDFLCHLSSRGFAKYPSRNAASLHNGVMASDAASEAMKMAASLIDGSESGDPDGDVLPDVDKVYVPEFQHEKRPQHELVIRAARRVLIQEATNRCRPKIPTIDGTPVEQNFDKPSSAARCAANDRSVRQIPFSCDQRSPRANPRETLLAAVLCTLPRSFHSTGSDAANSTSS